MEPVQPPHPLKTRPDFTDPWIRRLTGVIVALLVVLSICLGLLASVLWRNFSTLSLALSVLPGNRIPATTNILLLGSDDTHGVHRSDTLMVLHVNPSVPRLYVLSIPRDTLVIIPGTGYDKINHAFAYGGAELSRQTVANFLGLDIPYYVQIQVRNLERMINRVGGVTVDVEKRLFYTDYAGGLRVDLQPGVQKLTGEEALGYLRFRMDQQGDFGRIERQQKFLNALAAELLKPVHIPKLPFLLNDFLGSVETNIPVAEMGGFAGSLRAAFESENVTMAMLPGTSANISNVYYLRPNADALAQILRDMQNDTPTPKIPKQKTR